MATYRISGLYHLELFKKVASAIVAYDLYFAKSADFSPESETIEWTGDGQKIAFDSLTGVTVEFEGDGYDIDTMAALAGLTAITTGLPVGEAKRWNFGGASEVNGIVCGMNALASAIDVDTGLAKNVKIIIHRGVLSAFSPPAGLGTKQTAQLTFTLAAEATDVDLLSAALPGVTAGSPIYWSFAELT